MFTKTSTIFVTGTDTGVGKTVVTKALIEHFVAQGLKVSAMKPVAAGAVEIDSILRNEDADILLNAINTDFSYSEVNPYVFKSPIAPHIAAQHEGVKIDINVLDAAYEVLSNHSDKVIIEGAGGWQVPLQHNVTFADWVASHQWPVVLVVGIRVGCLNHAQLTYLDIQNKKNPLLGWVANMIEPDVLHVDDIIESLSRSIGAPMLGKIPYISDVNNVDIARYLNNLT